MTESIPKEMFFPIFWVFGWLAASIIYRKSKGKPIFYKKPAETKFRQANASGNSLRSWLTRMGGAHNCLVVQVTGNELDIHPTVPFNWFFLPEIYGLEHRMLLNQIVSVEIVKKLFWRKVEIEFKTQDGSNEGVSLWLKKPEDFVAALGFPDGQVRTPNIQQGSRPA